MRITSEGTDLRFYVKDTRYGYYYQYNYKITNDGDSEP